MVQEEKADVAELPRRRCACACACACTGWYLVSMPMAFLNCVRIKVQFLCNNITRCHVRAAINNAYAYGTSCFVASNLDALSTRGIQTTFLEHVHTHTHTPSTNEHNGHKESECMPTTL